MRPAGKSISLHVHEKAHQMKTSQRRIVADENIPLVKNAFEALGTIHVAPGRSITAADAQDADVLLVRSVTGVDAALLDGSDVQFVGSATIGTDHIDRAYLQERDIAFAHAPASNADSVADYVIAALLRLAVRRGTTLRGKTVGIVGHGNIGSRLARRLPALGLEVLANDPPLAEAAEAVGEPHDFVALDTVLNAADIITLHVPLTTDGPHATHHLFDEKALRQIQSGAWLLNTSRGPVVDNTALRRVLDDGHLGAAVLDVWENEPTPDPELIRRVDLATPHIAGYAYDGKVRGTMMLYEALCDYLDVPATWSPKAALKPDDGHPLVATPPDPALPEPEALDHVVRSMYEIRADAACLRATLDALPDERGAAFSRLRKEYPRRREFSRFVLPAGAIPAALEAPIRDGLHITSAAHADLLASSHA
jgi:erythronate-4-phosphate dehydrogenase